MLSPTVFATAVPVNAPRKLKIEHIIMALLGVRARVAIEVATAVAVS